MVARPITTHGLHVPGLYERIRAKELLTALSPDPRLKADGLDEHERATLEAQRYAPTVLGQTEALLAYEPVRFPRWWLGHRLVPRLAAGHRTSPGGTSGSPICGLLITTF